MKAIMARKIKGGDVIVIRLRRTQGWSRDAGDASAYFPRLSAKALVSRRACHGRRFSVEPGEWSWACRAGGLRRRDDRAGEARRLDHDRCEERLIRLNVSAKELAARKKKWKQPKPRYTRGLLAKYMKLVSTASKGAITDGA